MMLINNYVKSTTDPSSLIIRLLGSVDALSSFNSINFLHPKISMHILHTVLCTSEMVLTRKLCRTVKSFLSW